MTLIQPKRKYPSNLTWRRSCKNGDVANGILARNIAEQFGHIVAFRRKGWSHMIDLASIPAGLAATATVWPFAFHSGMSTQNLVAVVGLAQADNASATDPFVDFTLTTGFTGGSVTTSSEFHWASIDTSPSDVPDNFRWGTIKLALTADTDYRVSLQSNDYARPFSVCFYEEGVLPINTATSGVVDPQIGLGSDLLDSQISDYLTAGTELWQNNPGMVMYWCRLSTPSAASFSGATYANIFDSTTSVSSASRGAQVDLQYHNTTAKTTVPVKIAALVQRTAGAGTTTNNKVRITDGTNSVEVTDIKNTLGWITATGTMPATDNQKWDIQAITNASDTVSIHSVCVFEWE